MNVDNYARISSLIGFANVAAFTLKNNQFLLDSSLFVFSGGTWEHFQVYRDICDSSLFTVFGALDKECWIQSSNCPFLP